MTVGDPLDQLIAYVEGQLPADQRAEFERRLATSPQLRQQLELMKHVDDSLTNTFAAPGFVQVDFTAARAKAAIAQRPAHATTWGRWAGLAGMALAASIVVVLGLTFYGDLQKRQAGKFTVSSLYDGQVNAGFIPQDVCKDDADFADYSRKAFGIPLLAQSDSTVTIVGWSYAAASDYKDLGVSGDARIILAKAKGQPVILLLDKNNVAGPAVDALAKGRLNVFEGNVGGVHIFEITPLSDAVVTKKFVEGAAVTALSRSLMSL